MRDDADTVRDGSDMHDEDDALNAIDASDAREAYDMRDEDDAGDASVI